MFTPEEIETRVRERIFVPFRIVTSSGESFEIRHPNLIMVGERLLYVGLASPQKPTIFNRVSQVAIAHVTALEDLPQAVAPGGNGSQ